MKQKLNESESFGSNKQTNKQTRVLARLRRLRLARCMQTEKWHVMYTIDRFLTGKKIKGNTHLIKMSAHKFIVITVTEPCVFYVLWQFGQRLNCTMGHGGLHDSLVI